MTPVPRSPRPLNTQVGDPRSELRKAQADLAEARAEVDRLAASNTEKGETNARLYAANIDLRTEVDRLTRQLAEARADSDVMAAQRDRLYTALSDVLRGNWRHGHPGYAAMQSAWIEEPRFRAWRALLAELTPPLDADDAHWPRGAAQSATADAGTGNLAAYGPALGDNNDSEGN